MMARVSCIIACYNAAATLEAAVRSALAQVGVDIEVIISDDCSSDESLSKAKALAAEDPRVRVIADASRGGPSRARNMAIALATGDWIAILDADDEMRPHRLSRLVAMAQAFNCDVAFDNQEIITDPGDPSGPHALAFDYDDGLLIDVEAFLRLSQSSAGRLSVGYAKPIFAATLLKRLGLQYDERFSVGEDWKFFLTTLALGGRCVYVDEPMYRYYRPTTSLTLSGKNNYRVLLAMTRACEQELAETLRPQDRETIRTLCGFLWRKAAERTLRNTAQSLKAAVRLGGRRG
jgi:succinoglycan biosynthesis protein ExoO